MEVTKRLKVFSRLMFNHNFKDFEGYQSELLINTVISKNIDYHHLLNTQKLSEYCQQAYQTFSAINLIAPKKSFYRILDFGGGGGHHYAEARAMFPDKKFSWHIIETEKMVEAAKMNIHKPELKFHSRFDEVKDNNFDLVFCNSALQYTEKPLDTLHDLINLRPNFLFLTRTPLTYGKCFSYSQKSRIMDNGPGSFANTKGTIKYKCNVEEISVVRETLAKEFQILGIFKDSGWDNLPSRRMAESFTIVAKLIQA